MKIKNLFLATALAGACLGTAQATLFSYDGFDFGAGGEYTLGDIAGQGTTDPFYSSAWGKQDPTHDVQIATSGLVWSGLATEGGSVATGPVGRAYRNLATPWDNTTVGTYYISFLASFGVGGTHHRVVEAWSAADLVGADGTRVLELGYSTFTGLGTTLSVSINNGGDGVNEIDLDPATDLATDNGATHLFVLRFDLSATASSDAVTVYMDPTDLVNEPVVPSATLSGFDFQLASFGSVVNFVFDGSPTSYFDELRFGDVYESVLPAGVQVPEPGTLTLLGLGTLGLMLALRRKHA